MVDFLYIISPDNLVLPRGAPVTYGSGDFAEDWIVEELDAPGEIVFGFADHVPAATDDFASRIMHSRVNLTLHGENVSGVHRGEGIVLLDRDEEKICKRFVIFLILSCFSFLL